MDRLRQLAGQLTGNSTPGRGALFQKSPDDVVITMAIRTPLTKARKGGFKDTRYVCLVSIRMTIGHICVYRSDELVTSMFKVHQKKKGLKTNLTHPSGSPRTYPN